MEDLIFYLISLILVYLIYLFLIILRKKKKDSYQNSVEFKYLISRYKINIQKINMNKMIHILSLANAFIISTTVYIISFINNYILKILIGFVVLIPLCLIVYHIIGIFLKRKKR